MKDILKFITMLIISLIIAIFMYPFVHELGHSFACILLGINVIDFEVLPIPYILCDMTFANKIDTIIIGNAGNLMPAFIVYITYLFKIKNFNIKFARFYFNCCCIISYIVTIISIIITKSGNFDLVYQDDVAQLVNIYDNIWIQHLLIYIVLIIISLIMIIKNKPIKTLLKHFE